MEKINVIKVGGKIVEDSIDAFLDSFTSIEGKKILVHGGGRTATAMAARLGIETKMVDGRRITDKEMLDIVTMVYGGLVNKSIVSGLQARGVNAVGLTGADMDIIRSVKRPVKAIDYGYVGDVTAVRGDMIKSLIDKGITPVIAPLTHDGDGNMLNTNADTMTACVAKALAGMYEVTLTFCFEMPGVLRNPEAPDSVIPVITPDSFEELKAAGIITGGMIPKMDNALDAVRAGVSKVVITKADSIDAGTTVKL